MEKITDFKTRLDQLLREYDINQKDLSERTGITQATISRYLAGERDPVSSNIEKIAQYFNVQIHWLMGYGCDDEKTEDQTANWNSLDDLAYEKFCDEMKTQCKQLNITGQAALLEYVRLLSLDDRYKRGAEKAQKEVG